ncbi:response regulator [Methylobacterium flocculans]|uniref:response regulator n=1 Tax=Methylobacterium flocculans TaxID=2984843 RepID=UPI0021F37138|nr:response regulator [Methylobacterium sp. FF17]
MAELTGRRVLLVEDESLVAMLGEDMLLELGCTVDVAMRLEQGLVLATRIAFDAAVLDVNLGKTCSYPIADLLAERGIPFIFATGYGTAGIEAAYRGVPVMQKPYQIGQMATLLRHVLVTASPDGGADDGGGPAPSDCAFRTSKAEPAPIRAD